MKSYNITNEETVTETIELSNSYLSRKGQTYAELGTKAEDWKACDIIGYEFINNVGDIPIYHIPEGYSRVTTRFTTVISLLGHTNCNLCGHSIRLHHFIQNDKERLYMLVGCECVHNNYGRVVAKKIKEFKDNEIREKAKQFLVSYLEWAPTQKLIKHPSASFQAKYIKREVWEQMHKAEKLLEDFKNTGIKKLSNFMKLNEGFEKIPPVEQVLDFKIKNLKDLIYALDNNINNQQIDFGKHKAKYPLELDSSYISWAREEVKKNAN